MGRGFGNPLRAVNHQNLPDTVLAGWFVGNQQSNQPTLSCQERLFMYGLVNRGIEELVCTHFSEETWEAIKAHARINHEAFITGRPLIFQSKNGI